MVYEARTYRDISAQEGLLKFSVIVEESDLFVTMDACVDLDIAYSFSLRVVQNIRQDLKAFIQVHPSFLSSHTPIILSDIQLQQLLSKAQVKNRKLIIDMLYASQKAQVGPMACVAGITSEILVKAIQKEFKVKNVSAENGGDIYADFDKDLKILIYAGPSVLSNQLALHIKKEQLPLSICTSSGTVGHSFSYGVADACVVCAKEAALADAFATALANRIQHENDIQETIEFGLTHEELESIVIIKNDKIGYSENTELIRVKKED